MDIPRDSRRLLNQGLFYQLLFYYSVYTICSICIGIVIVFVKIRIKYIIIIYSLLTLTYSVLVFIKLKSTYREKYHSITWYKRLKKDDIKIVLKKKYKWKEKSIINISRDDNESDTIIEMKNNYELLNINQSTENDECAICLENMEDLDSVILDCGHEFHIDCLASSLMVSTKCPICRTNEIIKRKDFINLA